MYSSQGMDEIEFTESELSMKSLTSDPNITNIKVFWAFHIFIWVGCSYKYRSMPPPNIISPISNVLDELIRRI